MRKSKKLMAIGLMVIGLINFAHSAYGSVDCHCPCHRGSSHCYCEGLPH